MASHLKNEIKVLLVSLNRFVKKLPEAKQNQSSKDIEKICKTATAEDDKSLEMILKNLRYKYDFLRLTNPSIAKSMTVEKIDDIPEGKFEDFAKQTKSEEITEEMVFGKKGAESNAQDSDTADINTEAEDFRSGKYILKDGKLVKGEAAKRKYVEFSNWHAANVAPEDLKRHKELLDRQHYRGPFWEGKPKPTSILDEKSPLYNMDDAEPQLNPNLTKKKEAQFETVKR